MTDCFDHSTHVNQLILAKQLIGRGANVKVEERSLSEDDERFFKLFQDSTFEASKAAARKMKKIAKRQSKEHETFLLFHTLKALVQSSNSEMLSWPNSPLLVLLKFVDPNVLLAGDKSAPLQEGEDRVTLLHHLADLADPFDYSSHVNQLILAKQLVLVILAKQPYLAQPSTPVAP
jgi:hypothetical protein